MITTVYYGLTISLFIAFCLNIINISIQKITSCLEKSLKTKVLLAWLGIGIVLEITLLIWYASLFVFLKLHTLQCIVLPACIMMLLSILSLFTKKTAFFMRLPTRQKATSLWLRCSLLYVFFGTWLYMLFILYFMQIDNLAYIFESRKLIGAVFFVTSILIVVRLLPIRNPLQIFWWRYIRNIPAKSATL